MEESNFSASYKRLGPFAKTHNQFYLPNIYGIAMSQMVRGMARRKGWP
jgi:hypothetical protein